MKKPNGFSLIELMVVVVIVAILAAWAIPNYRDYVVRSKLAEAYTNLGALRTNAEQYFQDNRTYIGFPCPAGAVAGSKFFTYTCDPVPTKTTYTFKATGVAEQGLDGIFFTINEANAQATTVTAGSAMENNGYATNACWVKKTQAQGGC